jgi:hypothetical protein
MTTKGRAPPSHRPDAIAKASPSRVTVTSCIEGCVWRVSKSGADVLSGIPMTCVIRAAASARSVPFNKVRGAFRLWGQLSASVLSW